MTKQINTILVPVDFTENTGIAVSKALEFCQDSTHVTIHLLHVQRLLLKNNAPLYPRLLKGYSRAAVNRDIRDARNRLESIGREIKQSGKDIEVICWVSFNERVQESIEKKARLISADLIVIGKRSHHTLLTFLNTVLPGRLANATGIPVLTAKPGSLNQEIKTVVIPITDAFPASKLEMINVLKNKNRPQVRLVIFRNLGKSDAESQQLLLQTFRAFRSRFTNPVHYEILDGANKARALLSYCNKVGADILIVHPGAETEVRNWTNSHISDLLPAQSRTQVLAISQN